MADNSEPNSASNNDGEQPQQQQGRRGGIAEVSTYMLAHKVETALWATRALTLLFTLSYFLPFFATPESSYQRVLFSNAATSALRLHQRVSRVTLSREFLVTIIAEDSAHYLLFSLTFLSCAPITLVLAPIALFAVLHFASNTLVLCDVAGENNALAPRFLISMVEYKQRHILKGAAFFEIFLMPVTVLNVFFGRVNLAGPFIYYQFLSLRYSSRRNPYTRNMFYELRVNAELFAAKPSVPQFVKNMIFKCINLVTRLAPQQQPAQQ